MKSHYSTHPFRKSKPISLPKFQEKVPLVSFYIKTRGWGFVLAWTHRIFGLILIAYLLFHLYILSFLSKPPVFGTLWVTHDHLVFRLLAWLLAIPLIFHALNGARLTLYESFGWRNEPQMLLWGWVIGCVYLALLAFFLITGDSLSVSPLFFWLNIFMAGAISCVFVFMKIWPTPNGVFWKFQRVTGAFLFVMLPAHLLFMHTGYAVGHQASLIVQRMRHLPTMLLDATLVGFILYHAAYGLYSFIGDYLKGHVLRGVLALILILLTLYLGYVGLKFSFHLA